MNNRRDLWAQLTHVTDNNTKEHLKLLDEFTNVTPKQLKMQSNSHPFLLKGNPFGQKDD